MARVTFAGDALEGLTTNAPAASVRLLLPSPGSDELVIPTWNGNEFLLPDGSRPLIRTFTPRHFDADRLELDLDIVIHAGGAVSAWVEQAEPGDPAAVSGTGRGYTVDLEAAGYLLAGDETAIPAICQLVEAIPAITPIGAVIEITSPEARLKVPAHPRIEVRWVELAAGAAPGDALLPAVLESDLPPGSKVWAAGEAAAMHRLRRHFFDERNMSRRDVTIRGYWKHGR